MKKNSKISSSIAIYMLLTLFSTIFTIHLKSSYQVKSIVSSNTNFQIMTASEQSIFESMWANLFSVPRTKNCSKDQLQARIKRELIEEGKLMGQKVKRSKFWWVKKWGYGPISYFFDFLDPVLRDIVTKEFDSLYKDALTFPNEMDGFSDPFDFKRIISQNNSNLSKKMIKKIEIFTKNYDSTIYEMSANTVQIKQALSKWKWALNPGDPSVYQRFVTKYDMNFDGRLNAREIILGSLYQNKQTVGSSLCEHCYFEVSKTLDAMFLYLDCDNDGLLSSEEIWTNLRSFKRDSEKWNIFSFGNDENIRTAAINDFILKNMNIVKGKITRAEFRVGILLGFWDRQTEKTKILTDDSRNMKNLRWEQDDMIDIALYNYSKKKMANI